MNDESRDEIQEMFEIENLKADEDHQRTLVRAKELEEMIEYAIRGG